MIIGVLRALTRVFLAKAGFDYFTTMDGVQVFRKRR
jgi:hypothetical protein